MTLSDVLKTEFFNTSSGEKASTVIDLFQQQVKANPHKTAIVDGEKLITYEGLDALSSRIGTFFRHSIGEYQPVVPVCMPPGHQLIATILGLWKAGLAFAPLLPEWPEKRKLKILSELAATWVLTSEGNEDFGTSAPHLSVLPWTRFSGASTEPSGSLLAGQSDLAYVMYTSGSTGDPKGVMIGHAQLRQAIQTRITYYQCRPELLLLPSPGFDAAQAAILWPLCTGGKLFTASREAIQDVERLPELLRHTDTLLCVPAYYRFLLEESLLPGQATKRVILGGEKLTKDLVDSHFHLQPQAALYNEYGPTEATIWATVAAVQPSDTEISIGKPIGGMRCQVLDQDGGAISAGQSGELYLGGRQLAWGYWKDQKLTAQKFVPDPIGAEEGARLYATGDLVRQLADGSFLYEGRIDRQFKFQGTRIDPTEIEQALQETGKVREAWVSLVNNPGQPEQIVAFYIPKGSVRESTGLRQELAAGLPAHMVPATFIALENFPLTENGKVDHRALLSGLEEKAFVSQRADLADALQEKIHDAFSASLGIPNLGVEDNFFERGGNSLAAMRLLARLRNEPALPVALKDVFDHPTISGLHRHLKQKASVKVEVPDESDHTAHSETFALSPAQQSLWLIDQIKGTEAYHLPVAYKLTGDINPKYLEKAIQLIVERHPVLATTFQGSGQTAVKQGQNWKLSVVDQTGETYTDANFSRHWQPFFSRPFNLAEDFMLRAQLICFKSGEQVLGLVFHHIAFDDISLKIFLRELSENYTLLDQGSEPEPESHPLPFASYARHRQQSLAGTSGGRGLGSWRKKLTGQEKLLFPYDFPHSEKAGLEAGVHRFYLDGAEMSSIRDFSKAHDATLFMTLLATFKVLLYRYTQQTDICVGTTVVDRNLPDTENAIGYFINTLPLRTELKPAASFQDFLDDVRTSVLFALEHAEVPFLQLASLFPSATAKDQNPFFDLMFVMHEASEGTKKLQLPGVSAKQLEADPMRPKFALTLTLVEEEDGLSGHIEFDKGLFLEETVQRISQHYLQLLRRLTQSADIPVKKISLLSSAEVDAFSGRDRYREGIAFQTFFERFDRQVQERPTATALHIGAEEISFNKLHIRSMEIAGFLRNNAVKPGSRVALLVQRSLDMVAAMLGIWKAGAAYVPVDPNYPEARIRYILEDCGAGYLLTDKASENKLPRVEGLVRMNLDVRLGQSHIETSGYPQVGQDQPAYVIYTSGSTGKPKGVCLTQGNLSAFLEWCGSEFPSDAFESVYAVTSMCFDLSVFELFFPLAYGKPVRILPDALHIAAQLKQDSRVLINTVPSVVRKMVEAGLDFGPVSLLNMAGEPVTSGLLESLSREHLVIRNLYGPTEDTTYSTCKTLKPGGPITIGRPVAGSFAYVLDQDLVPCPVGVPGEIYLGGYGLASGYLNRPDLTAERFVPNPFAGPNGGTLYKTGDRGCWKGDGEIIFLGRLDNQVKLNGYRIELDEISIALQSHASIKNAVAVLQDTDTGEQQIVAFVAADDRVRESDLIAVISRRLPRYMVPSRIQFLDELPLSPNGKIDRKALERLKPEPIPEEGPGSFEAPSTLLESDLLDIWRKVLQFNGLGVNADFFDYGGNSLLAIRLIGRIRETLGHEVSISELFAHPSVRQVAALIGEQVEKAGEAERIPAMKPRPENIPLSFGQESLWLTDKLEGSVQYHIPVLLKLKGPVSSVLLSNAIRSIMERHEILRTVIREQEEDTWQEVMPVLGWQMAADQQADSEEALDGQMADFLNRPFDLGSDFMLRARQFASGESESLLMLVFHHIAFDGWSIPLFIKELFALLKAELSGENLLLPHLKIQYADYALWQRERFTDAVLNDKLQFWKDHLRGVRPIHLNEPSAGISKRSNEGATFDFQIGPDQKHAMLGLGKKLGLSPFMILLTVFKSLLERTSGQQDICVGTAVSGRKQAELEPLLGYFVNPLPIRTVLKPESTFTEILLRVKQNTLQAYEHQDVPFEKIVAATAQSRQLGVNPLFQVMFVMEYGNENQNFSNNLSMEVVPVQQTTSKFDLTFLVNENKGAFNVRIEYARDIFDPVFIEKLAEDFADILGRMLENPELELGDISSDRVSGTIGEIYSGEAAQNAVFTPAHQQIEQMVARDTSRPAVVFGEKILSYGDLNIKANQLAHYLLKKGLEKGDIVGLLVDRSPKYYIGMLGILKAGGAYLPVDSDFPDYRISYMLEDSCRFYLTESGIHDRLETKVERIMWHDFDTETASLPDHNPQLNVSGDDPAYIIYTSGTTGKPKGVRLDHANVNHFIAVVGAQPGLSKDDKILGVSSVSFDIAVLETLVALVFGARTYMLGQQERKEPDVIVDTLRREGITLMFATPSHWKMLLLNGWSERSDKLKIISGGEHLEKALADRLLPLCRQLWNVYGPTETSVYSTIKRVSSTDKPMTVGKPVRNTRIHILDGERNPVRKGAKGEIFIEGHGLARGYINSPDLTREKFLELIAENGQVRRLYKTGDLGSISADEELIVAGRLDHQVKIRGYRLELGEVENAIRSLKGVGDVIVHVKKDLDDMPFLVAYVVVNSGEARAAGSRSRISSEQVKQWKSQLSLSLADYMIPTDFVGMERFPLMENGKVNRNALPYPDRVSHPYVAIEEEMSPEERLVADIWKKALGRDAIRKRDNFFEIGGHSLTAVRVMVQLEKVFGIKLPLSVLFRYPTVQKLSQAIKSGVLGDSEWKSLVAIKTSGSKPPLYIVHGGGLNILPFYAVAKKMDREQPVFGIQAKGLDGVAQPLSRVEDIASQYLSEVLQQNPDGPYFLAGYSLGGIIAFEMAFQLLEMGKQVEKLVLFDTYAFQSDHNKPFWKRTFNQIRHAIGKRKFDVELLIEQPAIFKRKKRQSFEKKINRLRRLFNPDRENPESSLLQTYKRVEYVYKEACREYSIKKYPGSVDLIKARIAAGYLPDKACFGWKPFVKELRVWEADGEHITMLSPPNDASFGKLLQRVIDHKKE
ncbi:amino acid adenylation domain-containing protein [Cyclobacterium lianum]|uniref:Amino acid adenylation domain-containing protein n=1 Tax=Cyclobacterium lianum TaxID=388280 RepID=A0A1M7I418_9BACT|nr:amino acid adenylation domain-containing protein [Cyclobacterium lianum]